MDNLGFNSLGKPHHLSKFANVLHLITIVINNNTSAWLAYICRVMDARGKLPSRRETCYSGFTSA